MKQTNIKIGFIHFLLAGVTLPVIAQIYIRPLFPTQIMEEWLSFSTHDGFDVINLFSIIFSILGIYVSIYLLNKYYELRNVSAISKMSTILYGFGCFIMGKLMMTLYVGLGFGGSLADAFQLLLTTSNLYDILLYVISLGISVVTFYCATEYFLIKLTKNSVSSSH